MIASSKNQTQFKTTVYKLYPIWDQICQIDTLLQTETTKTLPLGAAVPPFPPPYSSGFAMHKKMHTFEVFSVPPWPCT